jgi:ATP/maltotriose-dependent transcriptional regulator MalT
VAFIIATNAWPSSLTLTSQGRPLPTLHVLRPQWARWFDLVRRSDLNLVKWKYQLRSFNVRQDFGQRHLIDHANAHQAKKRGGAQKQRVPIDEQQAREFGDGELKIRIDSKLLVRPEQSEVVLGVRKALELLRKTSSRQARVLQLQFYGGLQQEEIAAVLGVSLETVKLDARKAKAFLRPHLTSPNTIKRNHQPA